MYGVACMKLGDVRPGQETKMLPCQPTTEIKKKKIYIYILELGYKIVQRMYVTIIG